MKERKILIEVSEQELDYIRAHFTEDGIDVETLIDIIIKNTPNKELRKDIASNSTLAGVISTSKGILSWTYRQ